MGGRCYREWADEVKCGWRWQRQGGAEAKRVEVVEPGWRTWREWLRVAMTNWEREGENM